MIRVSAMNRVSVLVAALVALSSLPLAAQVDELCTEMPFFDHDATADNLLGISPGFVGEYCQFLDLEELTQGAQGSLCTNEGNYWVVFGHNGITRNGGPAVPVSRTELYREIEEAFFGPSEPSMGNFQVSLSAPPAFPGFDVHSVPPFDRALANSLLEEAGWVLGDDGVFVCAGWDGNTSTQAIPADVGPGPVYDILASFNGGGLWERVQDFPGFENYRASAMGVTIAPFGGSLTGSQVVPPSGSPFGGTVGVWNTGPGEYRFRSIHELPGATSLQLWDGNPGENGVLLTDDLGSPTSPIDTTYLPLDPLFDKRFRLGKLYVQIETAGGPQLRAQIAPADQNVHDETEFDVRIGLTHPGTPNCYTGHVNPGDGLVRWDQIEEILDPFANGTFPSIDENEIPLGLDYFALNLGISVDSGPTELFPSGVTEPGTGTPLTDGCLRFGFDSPVEYDHRTILRQLHADLFDGGTPQAATFDFDEHWTLDSDHWDQWFQIDLPGQAGNGVDQIHLRMEVEATIFTDGFESGNTSTWSNTVP